MLLEHIAREKEIRETLDLSGHYHKNKPIVYIDMFETKYDLYKQSGMIHFVYNKNGSYVSSERKSGHNTRFVATAFNYVLLIDTFGSGKHQNEVIEVIMLRESNRVDVLHDNKIHLREDTRERLNRNKTVRINVS